MAKRAESYTEFLTMADLQRCTQIAIAPYEVAISEAKYNPVTGEAREFALGVLYTAKGKWGRRVLYFERLMDRVRTQRGRSEGSALQEWDSLICFVTANDRAEQLRARRPDLTVQLQEAGGVVSDQTRDELLDDARAMNIKPVERAEV